MQGGPSVLTSDRPDQIISLAAMPPSLLDSDATEPLYVQVMQVLVGDIASGRLRPGQRLPSERALCDNFQISRVTARRALQALVEEGVVQSARGRGWFVTTKPERVSEPPNALLSFSAMAASRGLQASAKVLASQVRPANLDEADQLEIAPGADLFELERLRFLDGHPVTVQLSRLPLDYCPSLPDAGFESASIYDVLRNDADVILSEADHTVEAAAATARITKLLEVEESSPVLITTTLAYDQRGRPVEMGEAVYRSDRYRFRARLSAAESHQSELRRRERRSA